MMAQAEEEKLDKEEVETPEDKVETTQDEESTPESQEEPPPREPKEVTITDIELERMQMEAREFKDKYLRLLAESENSRKRLLREREDMIQYAIKNVIVEFLYPIDQMENALGFAEEMNDEIKNWAMGFEMIMGHFKDVLSNNGVTPFESVGKTFDPNCHEAVETVETNDHPPETVVKETLRGYKMGERTIRPARVVVSTSPKNKDDQKEKNLKEENENE